MRILHLLDHSAPLQSGYVSRTLAILRQQQAFGWQTIQLTSPKHPTPPDSPREEVDGVIFHRTPTPTHLAARIPLLGQMVMVAALKKRAVEIARAEKPDLLHAHSPLLNGLAALAVGRELGLPVIYEIRAFWEDAAASHGTSHPQGARYHLTRRLETHVMRQADAITVICEGLRRDIIARGIPPEKITTIPNAVEVERFLIPTDPQRLDLPELDTRNREILGYIGSFYAYEGLELLLEAMPAIRAKRPSVLLLLVGGGPEEARLRQRTRELQLDTHVHFTGRLPASVIPNCLAMVDLMLFPRLPMRLTHLVTPLKPLEAMAAGRLVLASDVGGHQELISHQRTGFLFPAGDSTALAHAVIALLADRASWPAVIEQARRFANEERTWLASARRYQPLYERLIARGDSSIPHPLRTRDRSAP
ncbi:D-inositol-3-phosphate glycosyltransferase [Candidatus Magnetaquicoccaceae bacterium FCR-1]|uniref:D-inositol-3-phosphate glycosyltransferase n=1 Tax=Candidatus Magnetaquiglobus chichijimensis TaxID=3141448 RepID=A0ABQ0C4U8_9PROT